MGKPNRKSAVRRAVPDPVLTPQRRQHGGVDRPNKQITDANGLISRPFIARDILDAMESRGSITPQMREAGRRFREKFARANLEALRCPDIGRIPGLGRSHDDPVGVLAARDDVWRMVVRVGGLASPAGSCLWHVLGLEQSLKEWAIAQVWNGRPCHQMQASGILVAALGTLAG